MDTQESFLNSFLTESCVDNHQMLDGTSNDHDYSRMITQEDSNSKQIVLNDSHKDSSNETLPNTNMILPTFDEICLNFSNNEELESPTKFESIKRIVLALNYSSKKFRSYRPMMDEARKHWSKTSMGIVAKLEEKFNVMHRKSSQHQSNQRAYNNLDVPSSPSSEIIYISDDDDDDDDLDEDGDVASNNDIGQREKNLNENNTESSGNNNSKLNNDSKPNEKLTLKECQKDQNDRTNNLNVSCSIHSLETDDYNVRSQSNNENSGFNSDLSLTDIPSENVVFNNNQTNAPNSFEIDDNVISDYLSSQPITYELFPNLNENDIAAIFDNNDANNQYNDFNNEVNDFERLFQEDYISLFGE